MAKPTPSVSKVRDVAKFAEAPVQTSHVAKFEVTGSLVELGRRLGVDIDQDMTPEARLDRAAQNLSRSAQYMLAAGIDLVALRAQCEHGTFLDLIQERGFSKDAAYRAISYAQFVGSRSPEEQARLLDLPKSKVLELAKADPMVVDVLMQEDGPIDMSAMNVRDMRTRILELERAMTDSNVQLKTAEAERDAAHKRLAKAHSMSRKDQVPTRIADIRAEIVVNQMQMVRLVESLHPMGMEMLDLYETDAASWVEPTAQIALAGLISAHHALGEQIKAFAKGFRLAPDRKLDVAFGLTSQELKDVAQAWDMCVRHADFEKAMRDWERSKDRPRGKGRPASKPEAPDDYQGD
jgi:predicted Holliday junction resolvase-like endonuclease